MKLTWIAAVASVLLGVAGAAHAQSSPSENPSSMSATSVRAENSVPISRLIATVAKKTGKKFVIDHRCTATPKSWGRMAPTSATATC